MTRANREVCLNMSANFAAAIDAFFSTSMNEAALAPLSTCADRRVQLPPPLKYYRRLTMFLKLIQSTCGLVATTSASRAEGRQFDPGQVYGSQQVVH